MGAMSMDYTGQISALTNIKTVSSSTVVPSTTTSSTSSGTIPKVILYWGTKNANSETLNARYVEYPSVFATSGSDGSSSTPTLINKNPNFAFTVNIWPTINRGDIITATLSSTNSIARDFTIQLINVLNPLAVDYNSMGLASTSIFLPPAINDNGQNSKFVIPTSLSGGYYIVNVFTKFQDKEFNAVYTGKLYIPYLQNKVTVSRTTTNTIIKSTCPAGTEKVGIECLKICQKGKERIGKECKIDCNDPANKDKDTCQKIDCKDPANKDQASCNTGAETNPVTGTMVPQDQGGSGGSSQGTDQGGSGGSDHESKDSHKEKDK